MTNTWIFKFCSIHAVKLIFQLFRIEGYRKSKEWIDIFHLGKSNKGIVSEFGSEPKSY